MTYANNVTITTGLSACKSPLNTTQTVEDLYNLYRNNSSSLVSSVFYNISIVDFNCTTPFSKYFQQVIIFTQSVSIRIQAALISVYFDYINGNRYLINDLNGFFVDRENPIYFSSASLNNVVALDACSSGDIAQDPLCLHYNSTPYCINLLSNPWIFNCSKSPKISTTSVLSTTNGELLSYTNSSILNSWQISLICVLSVLFLLISILVFGYLYRRRSRSKNFALTIENIFDEMKSMKQRSEIPKGQAFQRPATIIQPKQRNNRTTASIHDDTNNNGSTYTENYMHLKSSGPYNQGIVIDHTKIHDSDFPSNILTNSLVPTCVPNDRITALSSRVHSATTISRPVSKISTNQLKSKIEEDKLDASERLATTLSIDGSLHDEDAWMSILDVVNAEMDLLNRLENEQNQIKTRV
ncbi:unnamed protein product [Rotaria socialis]|uniref:Uncharacterized protein n=1 Tax=Rotaria socialis TaxID=392032 RepID=A0A821JD57_9BILA|nr:unnamed protein product [Rotaria socialis]CAF3350237.1 unnamed protein product [Rotaria socialis]CAF4220778.1 unnamed protein product [Rotaria socialis]CAF4720023.1 unnamed protein product [Rotaria socialis]